MNKMKKSYKKSVKEIESIIELYNTNGGIDSKIDYVNSIVNQIVNKIMVLSKLSSTLHEISPLRCGFEFHSDESINDRNISVWINFAQKQDNFCITSIFFTSHYNSRVTLYDLSNGVGIRKFEPNDFYSVDILNSKLTDLLTINNSDYIICNLIDSVLDYIKKFLR